MPILVVLSLVLTSCSVWRMSPRGPVLDEEERDRTFGDAAPSGVDYETEPRTDAPIVPFLVFGLAYDLDVVLVSDHPEWDMHEYARFSTPEGPRWIAKDARKSTGDQFIVADVDGLQTWLPEVPLPRKRDELVVEDASDGDRLDLTFRYENHDGEKVVAKFAGPKPHTGLDERNGSTMGHSRDQVLAVLDVPTRDFGDEASISFDGDDYPITRVLGLVPMKVALTQTQGGVAESTFEMTPDARGPGFVTTHEMPSGEKVELGWDVSRDGDDVVARQESELRTLVYRFRRGDPKTLELVEASVAPWDGESPDFHIEFAPALPDPRRRFSGRHRSRFVMDVGGQKSHAAGDLVVEWIDDRVKMTFETEDPWWVAERCAETTIGPRDDSTRVETRIWPCES